MRIFPNVCVMRTDTDTHTNKKVMSRSSTTPSIARNRPAIKHSSVLLHIDVAEMLCFSIGDMARHFVHMKTLEGKGKKVGWRYVDVDMYYGVEEGRDKSIHFCVCDCLFRGLRRVIYNAKYGLFFFFLLFCVHLQKKLREYRDYDEGVEIAVRRLKMTTYAIESIFFT